MYHKKYIKDSFINNETFILHTVEKKGWKILAIIFIVTQLLSLLFFASILSIGYNMVEKEFECANEICFEHSEAEYYYFDDYTYLCQCVNGNDEVIHQQIIK